MADQPRKHYDSINILEEDANARVADESGQGYFDNAAATGDASGQESSLVRYLATQAAIVFVAIVALGIATAVVATALVSSKAFHAAQKPMCDARYVQLYVNNYVRHMTNIICSLNNVLYPYWILLIQLKKIKIAVLITS